MADNEFFGFSSEWEDSIIRRAMAELGDEEGVRLFDEEQERMKREAEEEVAEMKRQGSILESVI